MRGGNGNFAATNKNDSFPYDAILFYAPRVDAARMVGGEPLLLMVVLFLVLGIAAGDFNKVPLVIVFIIASAYALFITNQPDATRPAEPELHRGLLPIAERVSVFSRGAGEKNLMMMIWIFILAGAFAASAKQMGAIDSTVAMTLHALPVSLLLPGLFLAACFVSLSIGTSVGTVMALVPVATGVASSSGLALPHSGGRRGGRCVFRRQPFVHFRHHHRGHSLTRRATQR